MKEIAVHYYVAGRSTLCGCKVRSYKMRTTRSVARVTCGRCLRIIDNKSSLKPTIVP